MTPTQFLNTLEPERKAVLSKLRGLILKHDKQVTETVTKMMGQKILYYTAGGVMKYALASPKAHMSLHSLVMYYGSTGLRERYVPMMPKAKFQKGCINFKKAEDMPLDVAEAMIKDSAKVSWPPQIYLDRIKKK
jgi:hypothetical protein